MSDEIVTPYDLPENFVGWSRKITMHLNFGSKGGMATFDIFDQDGNKMPFGYQYDTRKDGLTGFTHHAVEGVMTWKELREKWPELRS